MNALRERWPLALILAVGIGLLLLPVGGLGLVVFAVLLSVLVLRSERTRRWILSDPDPARWLTAASSALLAGVGVLFFRVLVFDSGDNAYLGVALIGFWLVAASAPFALATFLPRGSPRHWVVLLGIVFLYLLGSLSTLVLAWSLVIIPSQDYPTSDVFRSHVFGLILIVPALAVVLAGYHFAGRRAADAGVG